ncbi:MAG: Flp pilus assembly protein CpaB [Desulfuromonas sp.]|nr:MAG: Flp pilus assembly protein CpaB [Desulfuromonas sp.]
MKRYGALIALGLAILFGTVAVVLTNQWLSSQPGQTATTQAPAQSKTVPVVMATEDLGIGSRLSDQNLTVTQWPEDHVPRGAFNSVDQLSGRVAVTPLSAGQPILAAELAAAGSGAGLVALIEKGKRAMAIRVDEVTGVGGFILPNTMVDVIGVENQRGGGKTAETILKKIKVLATAQETFREEGKAQVVRTVTMELTPKQAEKLALHTHRGSVHLVLRNPLEEDTPEPPKKVAKAPSRPKPTLKPRVYKPAPVPFTVEIIRAGQRQSMDFKDTESEDRLK